MQERCEIRRRGQWGLISPREKNKKKGDVGQAHTWFGDRKGWRNGPKVFEVLTEDCDGQV